MDAEQRTALRTQLTECAEAMTRLADDSAANGGTLTIFPLSAAMRVAVIVGARQWIWRSTDPVQPAHAIVDALKGGDDGHQD